MMKILAKPLLRPFFVLLGLITRPMILGVRAVVENQQGEILLVRHTYVEGWHLPGGGVERGETLAQAITKEVLQEAAIELSAPPRQFHTYKNPRTSRFDHLTLFVCDDWREAGPWKPNLEIAEIGFFDRNALPEGTSKATLRRLAELDGTQPINDIW